MKADHAFTARATSTFGLDRLYRVYVSGNQLLFIKIGGQGGVAQGVAAPFGFLGGLLLGWLQKRSRQKLEQRLTVEDRQNLRDLLARDRRNFVLDRGQVVRATIEAAGPVGFHGPQQGIWKFEETNGRKHALQFEDLADMHEALAVLPGLLGPALTVNAVWNEQAGRYTKPGAPENRARRQKRAVALIGIFLASGFFIWLGAGGWTIHTVPAHYVGYLVSAIGIAGLLGINIWYGGPLDPRGD